MIILKRPDEIDAIRSSNRLVATVLEKIAGKVRPGVTTLGLDNIAREMVEKKGARPAFKGYRGYPFSICTSVNEEVVHGLPSTRKLEEGDIVSIDFGVICRGYYGDAAVTLPVGKISPETARLLAVTKASLYDGIAQALKGKRLGDISAAVQRRVETAGFAVVRDYVGHGIGKDLHEEPQIPNYGLPGRGVELKVGMVLAIEPMVNAGSHEVIVLPDGWTVVTADGKCSAHFEHSVVVTDNGPEILSELAI
jgi:methionyl aminopeptidase